MLESWEIRWFCSGEPSSEAVTLFPNSDWNIVQKRKDIYMRLPGVVDLGIKQREGRFEIKGRRMLIPHVQITPRVCGVFEQWVKWTFKGAEFEPILNMLSHEPSLGIVVTKQRAQRKYRLGEDFKEVSIEDRLDRGAFFELTKLEVLGNPWWSLGFEAFPDDSKVPEQVLALTQKLLNNTSFELLLEHSHSYPSWLVQFTNADT